MTNVGFVLFSLLFSQLSLYPSKALGKGHLLAAFPVGPAWNNWNGWGSGGRGRMPLPRTRRALSASSAHQEAAQIREKLPQVLGLNVPQPWDDIDLTRVLWDNLAADMQYWWGRPRIHVAALLHTTTDTELMGANTRRLMLILNNTVSFPLMPQASQQVECAEDCDPQLWALQQGLHNASAHYNLPLPDGLFLINVDDKPPCQWDNTQPGEGPCGSPFLSLGKNLNMHHDIIGPMLFGIQAQDVVPRMLAWQQKQAKAYFRGVPSCGRMQFEMDCMRTWVSRLASTTFSDRLDTGLVEEYFRPDQQELDSVLRDGNGPLPVLPFEPLSRLPHYRYLLAPDGHVAPYRLALLLATNSVVLKQESPWVEWYYRSLRPWVHYLPVMKRSQWDLFGAMAWVDANQAEAQAVTQRAQRFVLRYATLRARLMYWVYALHAYSSLVEDGAEWVARLRGLDGAARQQALVGAGAALARVPAPW